MRKKLPVIAVVGKPNAGKSTLINRICNQVEAIVHREPMITRDRKYYRTDWDGHNFYIMDTPGIDLKSEQRLSKEVFEQTKKAIDESDIIVFLVDIKSAVSPLDEEIADLLRKCSKPVVFAGNKWDNPDGDYFIEDYLKLGFGYPVCVSSSHGLNINDLLDELLDHIKKVQALLHSSKEKYEEESEIPSITILGQPNVGKSTLFNTLINEERVIVDEIEGTRRDSIDSIIKYNNKNYRFIDTAGLKRDRPREDDLDYYSKLRTLRSIEKSQVCLVLIDILKEITNQDEKIIQTCLEKGASVCVLFNKIDAVSQEDLKKQIDDFNFRTSYLKYVPVTRISALEDKGINKIFKKIDKLIEERNKKIPDVRLNGLFSGAQDADGVYSGGKKVKIKFIKQVTTSPPGFVVFLNIDISKKSNIKRFIEYRIREKFGFEGTPLFFKYKH